MRLMPSLVAVGALLLGHQALPAATVFSNADKIPVTAGQGKVVPFTLAEPMLVTSIRTLHTGPLAGGTIRVLRDGKEIYAGSSVVAGKNLLVAQPFLVFAPGSYVIETSSPATWAANPKAGGTGIAVVNADKLAPAALAAAGNTFKSSTAPVALNTLTLPAGLKPGALKQNLKDQSAGLATNVGRPGIVGKEGQPDKSTGAGDNGVKHAGIGIESGHLAPAKYGDTFAGGRMNQGRSGSASDYAGGGQGNASESGDDADLMGMITGMLSDAGGKVTGDPTTDAAEAAYMMSVGSDGYAATKDMSQADRAQYWTQEKNAQLLGSDPKNGGSGVSTPNEGDASSGTFRVFGSPAMRQAMIRFQGKAIEAKKGLAGGKEKSSGGGAVRGPNGQDDKPQPERTSGAINWETVFKINAVVNPTRQ